jgi:hypothetical protein
MALVSQNCLGVGYGSMQLGYKLKVEGSASVSLVVRQIATSILEEAAASVFRVEYNGESSSLHNLSRFMHCYDTLTPGGNICCATRISDFYLHMSQCENSSATFGRSFTKILKGLL